MHAGRTGQGGTRYYHWVQVARWTWCANATDIAAGSYVHRVPHQRVAHLTHTHARASKL